MKTQFWHLTWPDSTALWAEWTDNVHIQQVACPLVPGHLRNGKRITDLSVVLPTEEVPDFVWTWYHDCLVQERILDLIEGQGFTGFESRHVDAYVKMDIERGKRRRSGADGRLLVPVGQPVLRELVVTGWGGVAPPESGIKLADKCDACGWLKYTDYDDPSRLIDENQWDGSDFFMIWPMPKYVFATDRVAAFIRQHRLGGVELYPMGDLGREESWGFSPGRLSYWMPEDRAREIGEPLGIF